MTRIVSTMRLVHAADIHLDSPLRGLSRLEDDQLAATLRQATRRALENLVQLVLDEQAQALVIAGDVYDGDWQDYATGRFFAEQMGVLADHNVPVYLAAGNHDAQSEITRALVLPPNVTVLPTAAPATVVVDDLGLAVHGQGFPTRAVTDNLALSYPDPVPGLVNVGILHTAVDGAEGHAPYAPCTPDDLTRVGYDYFALGHVHSRKVVTDGEHVAAFSGNLQGRHPRETGPKGALVVDVEPAGGAQLRHVALDVARWAQVRVDVSGRLSMDDVADAVDVALRAAQAEADGRPLVARVELVGATAVAGRLADPELVTEQVGLVGRRAGVTVERVRARTRVPPDRDTADPDLVASIEGAARELAADHDALRALARPLERELGRPLRAAELLDLTDGATLSGIAARAGASLLARLEGEALVGQAED